ERDRVTDIVPLYFCSLELRVGKGGRYLDGSIVFVAGRVAAGHAEGIPSTSKVVSSRRIRLAARSRSTRPLKATLLLSSRSTATAVTVARRPEGFRATPRRVV